MSKDKPSHVPSGYEIGTDEAGLTARERQVRDGVGRGLTRSQIGAELGVNRQRMSQLVNGLIAKGVLTKVDGKVVVAGEDTK